LVVAVGCALAPGARALGQRSERLAASAPAAGTARATLERSPDPGGASAPGPGGTSAPALGADTDLGVLATWLGDEDEARRRSAYEAYLELDATDLPAISARVAALEARPRPAPDALAQALTAFRHGTGSRRADDRVDIAGGVLPALAVRRDAAAVAAAERVLLARALERIGGVAAFGAIADLYGLDGAPWEGETRRLVERVGARLGPAMVRARTHRSAFVRRWARWAGTELGFDQPGRAIQLDAVRKDHALLAETLLAYGAVRQMDAMRVIGSYLGHDAARVRAAAREALGAYGRNAIWVLREQYELVTGESATAEGGRPAAYLGWSEARLAQALYAAIDEARLAEVRDALEAGRAAERAGDLAAMRAHYDAVLAVAPELPQRAELAPGYAALADAHRAAGRPAEAEASYARALALAPAHERAEAWRRAAAVARADASLAAGFADTHALREAAEHDPAVAETLALVTGEAAAAATSRRRLAAGAGALLFAAAAAMLLSRRRRASLPAGGGLSEEAGAEAPDAGAAAENASAPGEGAAPRAARFRAGARARDDDSGGDTSPGSLAAPA
jgi:hypothetical protein